MSEHLTSWTVLAHVLRPQGRKGEVLAELRTDFPEKFSERRRVFLVPAGFEGAPSAARQAEVVSHWLSVGKNEGRVVLQFSGVSSITEAEALAGLDVVVPSDERVALADDSVYISELVGCTLYDRSTVLGVLTDVQFATSPDGSRRLEDAAALLVVESDDGDEVLVPFAKAFLTGVDVGAKRVDMVLPEGLVEVNRLDSTKAAQKR